MHVKGHMLSALPLGMCWVLTGAPALALVAMGGVVLVDADHVIDYVLTKKRVASLKTMRTAFETFDIPKNYFFLHSWELVLLVMFIAMATHWVFVWALLSGWVLHLVIDQIYNGYCLGRYNVRLLFYWFWFRWLLDFEVMPLRKSFDVKGEHGGSHS